MYLSNIKLWNFRKFGEIGEIDLGNPHLNLDLKKGLNALVGENDSGKSAIIDAIKLVLKTHSYEWIRITDDDFFNDSKRFRIELRFDGVKSEEAKHFTEWLGWDGTGEEATPYLRLIYDVKRSVERILPSDVKAGVDNEGSALTAGAREYLKVTYLKPLRDANSELIPKRNSRLSQIFQEHDAFKGLEEEHYLVKELEKFNVSTEKYFEGKDNDGNLLRDKKGKELKNKIDKYIHSFFSETDSTDITVTDGSLKKILEALELSLKDEINPGLGTLNRLFMASELIHLGKENWDGLRLGLIEELEAHLHPQAQMQIVETLYADNTIQLILTTHSPNLASKVKLENLIVCNNNTAFPMGGLDCTKLKTDDYIFLERFLDVTKSNLFFAKGVIMVEGWSEEILLPALARKLKSSGLIERNLTEAGVSIVNVANTAFLRYSRIFLRNAEPHMDIPIAIVTDSDIREYQKQKKDDYQKVDEDQFVKATAEKISNLEDEYNDQLVEVFVAPKWTLEYSLLQSKSLSANFQEIVERIHSGTDFENFEEELAKKLINKGLKKTEIAYQLAQKLDDDSQVENEKRLAQESDDKKADELPNPEIIFQKDDEGIQYLIDAIKYACRN
jgi:putative ATP-dependent endonuclease of the OLD family